MDAEAWNDRYRDSELVWSAGPNQFVEAELSGLPPAARSTWPRARDATRSGWPDGAGR